jgi:nickel/cobalt transporter (NicO) family protein
LLAERFDRGEDKLHYDPEALLVGAVAMVGVLHTAVPDHWVPIALIARQRGWSKTDTAWASFQAGIGHVLSTLLIALVVWTAGVAVAEKFGHVIDTAASVALITFGGWIAVSAWTELIGRRRHGRGQIRGHSHDSAHLQDGHDRAHVHAHGRPHTHEHELEPAHDPLYAPIRGETAALTHIHMHRHGRGSPHTHWHDHMPDTAHAVAAETNLGPLPHDHRHKTTARTALLLILGSSPMVEGIPAFFAAGKYGFGLVALMALVFAISTVATYMLLSVYSSAGLQRVRFGAVERYGEVLSGAFIAVVGLVFWIWPGQ